MALERLTLAPVVLGSSSIEDQDLNNNNNNSNDITINSKAPRLPRWTRQELLVLIQGKRVAENGVRRGRAAVMGFGSSGSQLQVEPKWSSVSSYCKRHGVNRGPVQCRKRWSNLAGDYKKIKEWESKKQQEAEDSFWVMRNDLRRERKLPGFFDREVYDILNDDAATTINATTEFSAANDKALVLSLAPSEVQPEAKTLNNEVVFDSGRTAAAAADGLFPNDDDDNDDNDDDNNDDDNDDDATPEEQHKETAAPPPTPISATQYNEPFSKGVPPPPPPPPAAATTKDKEATRSPETYQGRKRKRPATNADETSLQNQLIEAMERNGRLLSSQLEIQNTNSQLDREQRIDHANSLFAVLNKLADAMVRIADKL